MKDIEKVRESILDSASYLFSMFGYEKTTVDEIAKRAHKAKASVYYHFAGKIDIFKAVLENEFAVVRDRLSAIRDKYPEINGCQLAEYLMERMRLLSGTDVYKRYVLSSFMYGTGEMTETVDSIRESFDEWEYDYYRYVCIKGKGLGIFPDAVKPEAFGRMMVVLLKGLEIQFFHSEDYETLRSTYEAMVEMLIFRNFTPAENMN